MATRHGAGGARVGNGAHAGERPRAVHYPESDGKPMGETETHIREIMRLFQTLDGAFATRVDVYVGSNLLLYYEEGNPRAVVVPDIFVAVRAGKLPVRRIYKLWEEAAPPSLVLEVTSPSTRRTDQFKKPALYARLGVLEYVLYDPLGEYLRPALQGYRLADGGMEPLAADAEGALLSDALGLRLALSGGRLCLFDRATGAALLDPNERVALAEAARQDAEARLAALQAEVERLRREQTRDQG